MLGQIDLTHPAAADEADDGVAGELFAYPQERHGRILSGGRDNAWSVSF